MIEMSPGSETTAFFSFIGNNKGTVVNTSSNSRGFIHFGGTTPDGRAIGSNSCAIQAGGAALLWRRPTGRTDLFYSPEFKINTDGSETPVFTIEKTTGQVWYAASIGIRTGIRSLRVLH